MPKRTHPVELERLQPLKNMSQQRGVNSLRLPFVHFPSDLSTELIKKRSVSQNCFLKRADCFLFSEKNSQLVMEMASGPVL